MPSLHGRLRDFLGVRAGYVPTPKPPRARAEAASQSPPPTLRDEQRPTAKPAEQPASASPRRRPVPLTKSGALASGERGDDHRPRRHGLRNAERPRRREGRVPSQEGRAGRDGGRALGHGKSSTGSTWHGAVGPIHLDDRGDRGDLGQPRQEADHGAAVGLGAGRR